jgi:hypothetical protein
MILIAARLDEDGRDGSGSQRSLDLALGAVRNVVGIRCGAFSGNMKVSFQAARSIG